MMGRYDDLVRDVRSIVVGRFTESSPVEAFDRAMVAWLLFLGWCLIFAIVAGVFDLIGVF